MIAIHNVMLAQGAWERLAAAVRGDGGAASWLWWTLPVLLLGMLALTWLAWRHVRRYERDRTMAAAFFEQGLAIGLERAECTLLHRMAVEASLPTPMAMYTWDRAFEEAAAALRQSRRVQHMTAPERANIETAIAHLRNKLGLRRTAADPQTAAPAVALKVVTSNRAGTAGSLGEFASDAEPAGANRRRFPRVATSRPCRIAPFAFDADGTMGTPQYVPATLVEIGGTGLKVSATLAPATGDRVMVVTQLNNGRSVQGLARVRRVGAALAGARDIALEMIGLHPSEVAVLAEETQQRATSH